MIKNIKIAALLVVYRDKIAATNCINALLKQDYALEMIDMKDIAGKNKSTMERLKGRVIGKEGKAREEVERLTDTHISI